MEQKKLDLNTIIGFGLIFLILIWVMYNSSQKQLAEQEVVKTEQKELKTESIPLKEKNIANHIPDSTLTDSLRQAKLQQVTGTFAYAATLPSASEQVTVIENKLIKLTFSNKGGYISESEIKNFEKFHKDFGETVKIIKNNNAAFNIELKNQDGTVLNSKDLFFEPTLSKEGNNQVLSLKLKAGPNQFLEYRYSLKPDDYMMDFSIRTQGLNTVLNTSEPLKLNWGLKTYRNEKSVQYENRYTEVIFEFENGKDDYLGQSKRTTDEVKDLTYVAYKQHFFTSILLTDTPFEKAVLMSENLVEDESAENVFTKRFTTEIPLAFKGGELNYNMNWYYGPTDFKILNSYDRNLDEVVPLGWGVFGWINRYAFIPTFDFLQGFLPHGIAIIILTILVRLAMSPITYKSYLSQAKMKVLRPEMQEINAKFAKDPMKKQQETMKLYSKAGVNPMAGCIPALLQIPVFYALYCFFPSAFDLRQKSFLWADDLSSFDSILELPFYIPFYGNHVSLFPILASVTIFFYMKMTTGDQINNTPQQEGMPDMGKIMKIMIYISPLMMLIFFNNFASGLSLYYFISNLLTIGIMLVIKHYILDEKKIHAKIEENKQKPKKANRFQQKMQEMMEEAEKQKQNQNKKK
ncbi:MAG: membrane protein insertase YidC [Flavobacteriaceae bacterium]|jgi:YidC/Oxa1 family membrane protein insertase|nr:membrane protein insertase YidC [Flavobacteriaceae bacterium]